MKGISWNSCTVCGGECTKFYRLYDDRYGYPGIFQINKCCECGHKFISGNFTPEMLRSLYTDYYPRSSFNPGDYRPHREVRGLKAWFDGAFRSAFRWVPEDIRVLDIGCGFGETLGYYKSRGCHAYGVEADGNVREVAEKYGLNIHIGLFGPDRYEPGFFDYVTMDQVIEHVTDPVETLKGVATVLKTGGYAILSTPNSNGWGARVFGKKWINWHVPYHLQHFTVDSMNIVADKAGLTLEKYRTITSSEWLYYQWLHLLKYPQMGGPSAFWSPGKSSAPRRMLFMKMVRLIHKAKINHIVTRFFDALGLGDNYLFFLKKI